MGAQSVSPARMVEDRRIVIRNRRVRRLGDTLDCSTVMSYINPISNAECLFGSSEASTATDPNALTVSGIVSSQVGGAQDPCTAGGLLCPQPNSPGASLNPCCAASADSASGTNPTSPTSLYLLLGGGLLFAFWFLGGRR